MSSRSLLTQLIGSWDLLSYNSYIPSSPTPSTTTHYPLGPSARGILLYTPDGYMGAQLSRPSPLPNTTSTDEVNFLAYSGRYWLYETSGEEPLLFHEMGISNVERVVGQVQRRIVRIETVEEEGKDGGDGGVYLYLGTEETEVEGETRVFRVKWKRRADNRGAEVPTGGKV